MIEFLIRRADDDWFDISAEAFAEACHPASVGWADDDGPMPRLRIGDARMSYVLEDPGIQLSFEGAIDEERADAIAREIMGNVERATGQPARLVPI